MAALSLGVLAAAAVPGERAAPPSTRRLVELSITAAPARLTILPGRETDVYAFNGSVPGPTLELREGDSVVVRFHNRLPEPSTIHWHGIHLPFVADGSPFHPVPPGGTHDYVFTLDSGSAGTYWYHPHPHHATGRQVVMGLYGALIVRAPDDPLAGIPERILVLSDNRFAPDGAIDFPPDTSSQATIDAENGREGDVILVNGQRMPVLRIRPGEVQRWRIVNASAARVYRLAIPGHTFVHVGNDGGLFEQPVERDEIVLANAERVEVLVRGTGAPGSRVVMQTLPYDRYIPQTRPSDWTEPRDVAVLEYSADAPIPAAPLPTRLRHVAPLDTLEATATRVVALSQGMINGRHMDLERVDLRVARGATEIWQVENLVGMDHPFHLHGFRFQVLDRDGVAEPFRSWKDVVNVRKHETVRLIVRYDDYPGKWMFHCHILDHEDQGMMAVLEVTP